MKAPTLRLLANLGGTVEVQTGLSARAVLYFPMNNINIEIGPAKQAALKPAPAT